MQSKKIALIASVHTHIRSFHQPLIKALQEQGHIVDVICGDQEADKLGDEEILISIHRNPFNPANLIGLWQLIKLLRQKNYDLVHCHTPIGGLLTRLACLLASSRAKVVYTAHGFHFYKGAPALNWLIYYPIEWFLAACTDLLLVINQEDWQNARSLNFPARQIKRIPGVGVNLKQFRTIISARKAFIRFQNGYFADEKLVICVGEFNKNKNQQLLLHALALIKQQAPELKVRLILAGNGPLWRECKRLAKQLGVADDVEFLGYRNDLDEFLTYCDLAVSASRREGLPVSIIEALATGLPIVASDIRGHRDLVTKDNGELVACTDNEVSDFAKAIIRSLRPETAKNPEACRQSSLVYDVQKVTEMLLDLYKDLLS